MYCRVFPVLAFFGFGLTSCSTLPRREYHYITPAKSWMEARRYCREKYTDLATFESAGDINKLSRSQLNDEYVWIGMHDDPNVWLRVMEGEKNSWRWSTTSMPSPNGYQNWSVEEPNNHQAQEYCVITELNKSWSDRNCNSKNPFVCYDAATPPGEKIYSYVERRRSWAAAQKHCRTHHTDLAMIENDEENTMVLSIAKTNAWMGLYRLPWEWSDRSSSPVTNFKVHEPNNGGDQHCIAEQSNHKWIDESCSSEFPFLCHEDILPSSHIKPIVKSYRLKMKMQSDADLSESAVNHQIVQELSELLRIQNITDFKLKLSFNPQRCYPFI